MSFIRRFRFSVLLVVGAALALILGAVACSGDDNDEDNGEDSRWVTCHDDRECDDGFVCDRELRRCVCTSDDACGHGLYCNAFTGLCVSDIPGCTSDDDCEAGQYCEIATRSCRNRLGFCDPCSSSVQCGTPADRCILDHTNNREYCGKVCSSNDDCPDGATCQRVGGEDTCWPTVGTCDQLQECIPNSNQHCETDEDCTEGEDQICDEVQNICVARIPTCPHGMVCSRETKRCEAACVTDEDCYATDPTCDPDASPCRCTNNECMPVLVCRGHADCQAGRVCVMEPGQEEGECMPDCQGDDARCPPGQLCEEEGSRFVCVEGCTSSADCAVSENCVGGRCRAISGMGEQYCQMSEVCELCEICREDGADNRTCQRHEDTCSMCSAPMGGCSATGDPSVFCCALSTSSGYLGIDCGDGQLCPAGHQCVPITSGGNVVASNCFPTSDSVCQASTCQ